MGAKRSTTKSKKAAMLAALEQSLGVITTAAKAVGISRETHRKWCISDHDYAQLVSEIDDVALDFGESMLHKNMRDGKEASTIYFLKTKARKRGYIEMINQEIVHSGSISNLTFNEALAIVRASGEQVRELDNDLQSDVDSDPPRPEEGSENEPA